MIWNTLLKKPMLVLGIILFTLFLTQETTKKWWQAYKERFIPSTCRVLKEKLDDIKNWQITCPHPDLLKITLEFSQELTAGNSRITMYKLLANAYVQLASRANLETLETLKKLDIIIENDQIQIWSQSTGAEVVGFAHLTNQEEISSLLQQRVRVKEIIKVNQQ